MSNIEKLKNQLNLELRELLAVVDMIDGETKKYKDYKEDALDEEAYLEEQLKLVVEAKNRLINIFK